MALIPDNHSMFVVDLHYIEPFEKIDPLIDEHIDFLKQNYASGRFIASGKKVPRTGGIIIAVSDNKRALETCLKDDPFHKHGVAQYTITEFEPSMRAPQLVG